MQPRKPEQASTSLPDSTERVGAFRTIYGHSELAVSKNLGHVIVHELLNGDAHEVRWERLTCHAYRRLAKYPGLPMRTSAWWVGESV